MAVIGNHIVMPAAVTGSRTKINQLQKPNVNTKVQETVTTKIKTATADTFQYNAKTQNEITTQETTGTLNAEVGGVWQESRTNRDQADVSDAFTKAKKTVKTNTKTSTTKQTTINTDMGTTKQSKLFKASVNSNNSLQENKLLTSNELAVNKNTSIGNSRHVTPKSENRAVYFEPNGTDLTENDSPLSELEQKSEETKMDKENISPQVSAQVIRPDFNRATHFDSGVQDITEKENNPGKGKKFIMDKEDISQEDNGQVISHDVIKTTDLESNVKGIMGNDKIPPNGNGQVKGPDFNKEATLEADVQNITEKENRRNNTDQKEDKTAKEDKENFSKEGIGQEDNFEAIRVANLKADVKDIKEEDKSLNKTNNKVKSKNMREKNESLQDAEHVTRPAEITSANLEVNVKDLKRKEQKRDTPERTGTNTDVDKENISTRDSGQITRPNEIEVTKLEANIKDVTKKEKKIGKSDQQDKTKKMDKDNLSLQGSMHTKHSDVIPTTNLKTEKNDIKEKEKKISKSKTFETNKEIVSPKGEINVTRSDLIKTKEKNLSIKDKNNKHVEEDIVALPRKDHAHKTSESNDLKSNGKSIEGKAKQPDEHFYKDINIKRKKGFTKSVSKAPNHKTEYIIQRKDKSDEKQRREDTQHYGKDDGSHYIKTKYVMHKLLKDNGPNLSAKQRAGLVKERCNTFLEENNIRLNPNVKCQYDDMSFLTSRKYDISICFNSKVASTNTKRVLYALDNKLRDDINSLKQHETREYSKSRLKQFKTVMSDKRNIKVMMVREPLERLLSAYRDERGFNNKFQDQSFSFKTFLQLILDQKMNNMNRHVYPYFERCRPCEMQFDYIGIQDRFDDDIEIVLQKIGADGKIQIPNRTKTGYTSESSDKLVKKYFKDVPNDMVHKLWEKYYKDYYIFGFPYPAHLMN